MVLLKLICVFVFVGKLVKVEKLVEGNLLGLM